MKLPRMLQNLWIYRRLLMLAVILGVALYFVVSNGQKIKVAFPFLGEIDSTSGIVMLASAAMGAAACWLVMTFRQALREARGRAQSERPGASAGVERYRGTGAEARKPEGPASVPP